MECSGRSEYRLWRVYEIGGPEACLKVRFHDDAELTDWRRGPNLADALRQAAVQGWDAYDSEPGTRPASIPSSTSSAAHHGDRLVRDRASRGHGKGTSASSRVSKSQ